MNRWVDRGIANYTGHFVRDGVRLPQASGEGGPEVMVHKENKVQNLPSGFQELSARGGCDP